MHTADMIPALFVCAVFLITGGRLAVRYFRVRSL
jgi:hypothetical protein